MQEGLKWHWPLPPFSQQSAWHHQLQASLGSGDFESLSHLFSPSHPRFRGDALKLRERRGWGVVWVPTEWGKDPEASLPGGTAALAKGRGPGCCGVRDVLLLHGRQGCQGRLAFRQGEELTAHGPSRMPSWLCVLRPDTWSLHTGPCPGCLSSPCLGPNLCQAEADARTGVTSVWLPVRKLVKEKLFP